MHQLPANSKSLSRPCGNKDHAAHRAGRHSCEPQAILTPRDSGSFHLNPPPQSPRCGPCGSMKGRAIDLKTVSSSTYRRRPGDKRTVTVSFPWDQGSADLLSHSHSTSLSGRLPLRCPHTAARLRAGQGPPCSPLIQDPMLESWAPLSEPLPPPSVELRFPS